MRKTKILGIIGGMGPLATVVFFEKLVNLTPAAKDQDHPRILVDCNPRIPDRTAAITGRGPSPVPLIVETGKNLRKAGANILAMPCVTAHCFFEEIQRGLDVPVIHMIRETVGVYCSRFFGKKAGLLATDGTLASGVFEEALPPNSLVLPDADTQGQFVMKAIYGETGVKTGDTTASKAMLLRACNQLIRDGADLLIAGCTEVSVVLKPDDLPVPLLDPVDVLADVCLERMGVREGKPVEKR